MQQRAPGDTCVACLDSRRCWVCEGKGRVLVPGTSDRCSACAGDGTCRRCAPAVPEVTVVPQAPAAAADPAPAG